MCPLQWLLSRRAVMKGPYVNVEERHESRREALMVEMIM